MKKLILALMLSILLGAFGIAYAIVGVADDVPGTDIVFPIICEGYQPNNPAGTPEGDPVFGSLNTIWAIAETKGATCTSDDSVCAPHEPSKSKVGVIRADVHVFDKNSVDKYDDTECWSKYDVISNDCQSIVSKMDPVARDSIEVTIEGKTYFVGYITYSQAAACNGELTYGNDSLIPWVYLNDIAKGFAAGYNGFTIENGLGPQLEERCLTGSCAGNYIGITAHDVYPRYYIMNNNADTFTWWIFLLGRNEYAIEANAGNVPANNIFRNLTCFFCDEAENCISNSIRIPDELNIIDVEPKIPGGIYSSGTYPKAGFAYCTINEAGFFTGQTQQTSIVGTLSFDSLLDTDTTPETYSLFGLSYQRAKPSTSNAYISVVHPIHRTYCSNVNTELPNRFAPDAGALADTVDPCSLTGFVLIDLP